MNATIKEQTLKDFQEILSTEAGQRIFGGIFFATYQNATGLLTDYQQGIRDAGLRIANTIREMNPYLITLCEVEYKKFIERGKDTDGYNNSNDTD